MSEKIAVVALGHRALGTTLPEQKIATRQAAKAIADLIEEGTRVIISHSNGPQVGMIHTAMNEFGKAHPDYTFSPMSVCSAMSQGYIGYDLQNAIRAEFLSRGISKPVATILTQVVIDPYDEAFAEPEKIIGRVLTEEEAEIEEDKGNYVTKVTENGYRRILAAPKPLRIVELETIRTLLNAAEEEAEIEEDKGNYVTKVTENGYRRILAAPKPLRIVELETIRTLLNADQVVIAAGGGGIPVMEQGIELHGASAIIEKDLSSGLLAESLQADTLLILTSVAAGGGGIPVMEQGIELHGASAIIEKDLSSGLLAESLQADTLLILTSVEKVSLNLGTDQEEYLDTLSVEEAKTHMEANQFAPGSMLPKFQAGISFIEKGNGRRAIITDIAHARDGYLEKTGTIIK